jgi:hypothetical protein
MSPEVLRLLWRFAALPVLIGLVLGVVLLIYIRSRKAKPPDFWKLASERPDHAYDWFVSHDGWVVVDFDARRHKEPKGAEVVGRCTDGVAPWRSPRRRSSAFSAPARRSDGRSVLGRRIPVSDGAACGAPRGDRCNRLSLHVNGPRSRSGTDPAPAGSRGGVR